MISNGIDGILAFFEQHSVIGMMNLQPHAEWLIYMFAVLDLAMTYVFVPENSKQKEFLLKIVRYGFFLTIIRNFQDVANMLFKTFATAGSVAASGTANAVALSPGSLWNKGFDIVNLLFEKIFTINPFTSGFGLWFLTLLAICFTAIATFKMVFQFLEMKIEFCIFSSVAIFFIPFTCVNQLSFLFQRIVTGFFSALTKIMVMYFMLALVQSEITNFALAAEQTNINLDVVNYTLRFLVMGLLVANLPQFAANIMAGGSASGGQVLNAAMKGATIGVTSAVAKGAIGGTGFAAGAVQQYRDRLAQGATTGKAVSGTASAVMKDAFNAAVGNPAGKVWFPAYDRGRSQTLRRGNPFENYPHPQTNQITLAQREASSIAVAKTSFEGVYTPIKNE